MNTAGKLGLVAGLLMLALPASAAWRSGGYYADGRYDRHGVGAVIRCESRDGRTAYCNVDIRGGVRLVRQHSRSNCIRGHSWGVNSRGLWVSRGCRGDFLLAGGGLGYDDRYGRYGYDRYDRYDRYGRYDSYGYGYGGYDGGRALVRCESRDSRTAFCRVGASQARLVEQISRSACIRGRSWGVSGGSLWVSRGCRGIFEVAARRAYGYRY